jgi:signal transduction histidine kinase
MAVNKCILVIDDERRMADSLKTLLSKHGYDVTVAYSGADGIAKIKENLFPLIITDLRMPDIDGYEVMKHIQEHAPGALIIAITGYASTESAIEALHYKAFDYIPKPFEFDLLKASVEKAFTHLEAERFKEDMVYMITHDIKVPLTSVIGYASVIFDKKTNNVSARAREFVNNIITNSHKILAMIENFLTSHKIESGKLLLCEVDVNVKHIIEDLLAIVGAESQKRGLEVESALLVPSPPIRGDEHLLFRALSNVVSNAIKFTPDEGSVMIKTKCCSASESPLAIESLLIAVSNTGPGIPEQDLDIIFEKYCRASNAAGTEGSGLGLYVVKSIVEAHNGKVLVSSTPDELTTFSIFLPLAQAG